MSSEDDSYSQPPLEPGGCRAVVPLSDGTRLLLADGSVVRVRLEEAETGAELPATATGGGRTVYGWPGDDHASSVTLDLIRDDEAAQHEMVRESLEALGFWDDGDGIELVPRAMVELPATGLEVWDALRELGETTADELVDETDLTGATVRRRLSDMEERGLVERIETGPPTLEGTGKGRVPDRWRAVEVER